MVRTFCTNQIRNTEELSGSVWSFVPESGEHAGTSYSVVVPTVWENLPEFASYRGRGCFRRKFYGEGNVRLVCKGISHTAEIYLDGRENTIMRIRHFHFWQDRFRAESMN